ncbi:MAG: hypothetical protein AMJ43_06040 [Coxiella sp. DG_40]|nr:MAG: hypothetical protein AMJ43_06040 [Coxiella sp. DG_40]
MTLNDMYLLSRHFLDTKAKPYKRYFIKTTDFKNRLSILLGQRGIGKTTTLIQYLLDQAHNDKLSPKILYIQADHFLMRGISLYEIAEQHDNLGGKFIAFDEIHKYNNWSKELKSIYDTFPDLKILASGSSALEIYKASHDLSRRAAIYSMQGLSFREYLELNLNITLNSYTLKEIINKHEKLVSGILEQLKRKNSKILAEFYRYLEVGYYPYFHELQDRYIYFMTLEQNLHATIESDLVAVYPSLTGNSIKKIKQLLTFISGSVPFSINWLKLKNVLDIGDERTLKTYFKYLEDAGVIRTVMKSGNKLRKLEIPEKIYLNNPNQYYALATRIQNQGAIRETFFLSMLSHAHDVTIPASGDFLVDGDYIFEIGGKKKDFNQIKNEKNAYLACDGIEIGIAKKIPLWLFGFLY